MNLKLTKVIKSKEMLKKKKVPLDNKFQVRKKNLTREREGKR